MTGVGDAPAKGSYQYQAQNWICADSKQEVGFAREDIGARLNA